MASYEEYMSEIDHSKDQKDQDQLVFHYSREHRLQHASETVKNLNTPGTFKKPGLIRSLLATKAHAFLLLAIIILATTTMVLSFLNKKPSEMIFADNRIQATAFIFQEHTYIIIQKTKNTINSYTGEVKFAFCTSDGKVIQQEQLFFSNESFQEFRYTLPEKMDTLIIFIEQGEYRASIEIKVKK